MTEYLTAPIDIDQSDVLQLAYDYIQSIFPNWTPADGNLDTAILEAISTDAASLRELAADVPSSIFRWFGATLMGIQPIDATPAISTVTFHASDSLGHTIPAGTQVAIPTADESLVFETLSTAVIPAASSTVAGVSIEAVDSGSASSGIGTVNEVIQLIDALAFISSVTLDNPTTGGLDAEDDDTYLDRLTIELRLISPRLILPSDFAAGALNIPGVERALAIDGYNPQHNLLTATNASLEASIGDWIANANCTVAWDATWGADGSHSLKQTSVAAGNMDATLNSPGRVPVTPGETYTVLATVKPALARNCYVGIAWYDAGGAWLGTSTSSSTLVGAGVATQLSYTGVAVAGAAFAQADLVVIGTAAGGEVANWDKMSLRRGTTTDWVPGGTGETNQPRTVAVAAVDAAGNAVSAGIKTQLAAYFAANREVNFIANVIDPTYTSIDVTFAVTALPGWDTVAVHDAIVASIAGWLDPSEWGQDPTVRDVSGAGTWVSSPKVRYLDLAALIRDVGGVAYVNSVTFARHLATQGTADVTLPGVAPLTTPGTIVGTVT